MHAKRMGSPVQALRHVIDKCDVSQLAQSAELTTRAVGCYSRAAEAVGARPKKELRPENVIEERSTDYLPLLQMLGRWPGLFCDVALSWYAGARSWGVRSHERVSAATSAAAEVLTGPSS
jgi:hypothetical protein